MPIDYWCRLAGAVFRKDDRGIGESGWRLDVTPWADNGVMKVFISSLIQGFEPLRDAAVKAISTLGHDIVRAE